MSLYVATVVSHKQYNQYVAGSKSSGTRNFERCTESPFKLLSTVPLDHSSSHWTSLSRIELCTLPHPLQLIRCEDEIEQVFFSLYTAHLHLVYSRDRFRPLKYMLDLQTNIIAGYLFLMTSRLPIEFAPPPIIPFRKMLCNVRFLTAGKLIVYVIFFVQPRHNPSRQNWPSRSYHKRCLPFLTRPRHHHFPVNHESDAVFISTFPI